MGRARLIACCWLVWAATLCPGQPAPDRPGAAPPTTPQPITAQPLSRPGASPGAPLGLDDAVALALQRNPELGVVRSQRGIAAAGVVIARTYPFNPIWQSYYLGTDASAKLGHTARFATIQDFRLDLELRGQARIRAQGAQASLSRAEWEIATQELIVAVRAVRAFNTLLYRHEKIRLLEDAVAVQEEAVHRVGRLVQQGLLKPADLYLARGDLVEARAAVGPARALLVAAWVDLRRQLGQEGDDPALQGVLDTAVPDADLSALEQLAREHRPDLQALRMIVAETEQRLRLEVANRFGNPSVGPAVRQTEEKVTFTGIWMIYQLPVLNTRRGEILTREAERDRAIADERRLALQVAQDVQAAQDRLSEARKWVHYYAAESLPTLRLAAETLEKLFAQGEPGIDVLRPIDAQRRLLRARDNYLDALWELAQARADLAAAVGDFRLAICPAMIPTYARPALLPPTPHVD